jgi:hypothetical protein
MGSYKREQYSYKEKIKDRQPRGRNEEEWPVVAADSVLVCRD